MNHHSYKNDIELGKTGENIFTKFMINRNIEYVDVSNNNNFYQFDADYLIKKDNEYKWYDVKFNYKNDNQLILETFFNCNLQYGKIRKGWVFTSWSDYFIFISDTQLINLSNSESFQEWLKKNVNQYHLYKNKPTHDEKRNYWWQGAYIRIPLEDIPVKFWKKIKL